MAHALQHCTALRDHLVVLTSSGSFESRLSVIVVVWPRVWLFLAILALSRTRRHHAISQFGCITLSGYVRRNP